MKRIKHDQIVAVPKTISNNASSCSNPCLCTIHGQSVSTKSDGRYCGLWDREKRYWIYLENWRLYVASDCRGHYLYQRGNFLFFPGRNRLWQNHSSPDFYSRGALFAA